MEQINRADLDQAFQDGVAMERYFAQVSIRAESLVTESGLSRTEIARRMGCVSARTLGRLLTKGMGWSATVETLARLADACGYTLRVEFVPKQRTPPTP